MMSSRAVGRMTRRRVLVGLATLAGAGMLSACGLSGEHVFDGTRDGVVVGSAGFAESQIIAEIYSQALVGAGITSSTVLGIGAREAYMGAVASGAVDVVPEYSGNLLLYLDDKATASTPEQILAALPRALPQGVGVLEASHAENKDSLVVTEATAGRYGLKSIADLGRHCAELKLGAAPEFAERPYGVPGLREKYGCTLAGFTPISDNGGALTIKALLDNTVQVADVYSTTPAITSNNLVVLEDPKNMILAQQVLPVIHTDRVPDNARVVLNKVSAALSTDDLRALNERVSGDEKATASAAAANWLEHKNL